MKCNWKFILCKLKSNTLFNFYHQIIHVIKVTQTKRALLWYLDGNPRPAAFLRMLCDELFKQTVGASDEQAHDVFQLFKSLIRDGTRAMITSVFEVSKI